MALVPAFSVYAFEPTGEIYTRVSHVKFDDQQVIGPRVNMTRRSDGTWGGWLRGRPLDITLTENGIRGVGLTLYIKRNADYLVLHGYYENNAIRVEWPTEGVVPTWFWYRFGGVAARPNPPVPQFLLALLAVS
jgi:hypothetical protein